jgi:mRNA-degrading endonuclease toxin of MazEF toxin-antitoxin module
LIFFDWEDDGIFDHVGIVERADAAMVYTIDKARLREYIGTLDGESMGGVDRALAVSFGLR